MGDASITLAHFSSSTRQLGKVVPVVVRVGQAAFRYPSRFNSPSNQAIELILPCLRPQPVSKIVDVGDKVRVVNKIHFPEEVNAAS